MNAPAPISNVTRLPTAAPEPVQQFPRKGRFPKSVASFSKAWTDRQMDKYVEEKKQREIAKLDEEWWQALCYLQCREIELRALGAVPTRMYKKWS
ncbi:hypothetical protein [Limnohabitans sp. TS-CS-82]|uniref:hypothetical protein n=1 Tax=Limnohabitans sp. TS-CS-82 TaxID=2094193 RepID=UPI0011B065CC|nr:hypothetical protein [Limnohabitans sp. TS-CS-82]